MGLSLENALAEELPSPHLRTSETTAPPTPSDPVTSLPLNKATEKDKMIAACVGAVVTSLTMTPFDVVKTRLQTAPTPRAAAAASHTPFPPPIASTSSAYFAPDSSTPPSSSSSSSRRFEPRVSRAALPASGSHAVSLSPSAALHLSAAYPSSSSSSSSSTFALPSTLISPSPSTRPRAPKPPGFFSTVLFISRTEGTTALWRGTAPALAMSVPGQVIYMLGYDWGRRTAFLHAPSWGRTGGAGAGAGAKGGDLTVPYTTAVPLLAGAASRTVVAVLLSPFELIRTQLQSQTAESRVPLSVLLRQLGAGGAKEAWRGLGPTLWRDVPFSAVYWAGYEGLKRGLTGRGFGEKSIGEDSKGGKVALADRLGMSEFGVAFVSGAGSGMMAATLTNPFDVIKTRRQALVSTSSAPVSAASTRTFPLLMAIVKEDGIQGWWRGLVPRLAKVGPACGLMIGTYEALSSFSSASPASSTTTRERID